MRNTKERKSKGKGEIRWDFSESGVRIDEATVFTKDYHNEQLIKICDKDDFVAAINRIAAEFMSLQKPEAPNNARFNAEYRKEWVRPTLADMKETLLDLKKAENKVKWLGRISMCHPIFNTFKIASYKEDKTLYHAMNKLNLRSRIKNLDFLEGELETTPKDHPCCQVIQDRWDQFHKTDFEDMNTKIIPALIDISLKHLQFAYMPETTNSASQKRFVALRLGHVFKRFGLKPSTSKDGILCNCIAIVLDAVGQPTKNPHQYIPKGLMEELKKIG